MDMITFQVIGGNSEEVNDDTSTSLTVPKGSSKQKNHSSYIYQAVPYGDTFNDLCSSVIYIVKIFHQKYRLIENIDENRLKTIFNSSKKILQVAISLLCDGQSEEVFNYVLELEFNRALNQNPPISDLEMEELILAKDLMHYIRIDDKDKVYSLISYLCSSSNDLMPVENWYEIPV